MESRLLAMTAVTMRATVTKVCARPFVAPSDLLLGAAEVMNISIHPGHNRELIQLNHLKVLDNAPYPSSVTSEKDS